ncbi:MAG: adenylate/guanylate cyclase domain-containing protein [Limibacillus sp.]
MKRRLAAILAADVVGFSRLMGLEEAGTLERLKRLRSTIVDPSIRERGGRVVKLTGDGLLAEFPSVVEAIESALTILRNLAAFEPGCAEERRIRLRIGIHIGDIIIEGSDIYGDGVNLAARLEGIADPDSLCVSEDVYRQARNKLPVDFIDLGMKEFKNIADPLRVYRIDPAGAANAPKEKPSATPERRTPSIAILPFKNLSGDASFDYFCDGLAEDLITELARHKHLLVIGHRISSNYAERDADPGRIHRETGANFILDGSLRVLGNSMRVTIRLIDAISGEHVWGDRMQREVEDVFALQDEIVQRLIVQLTFDLDEAVWRQRERDPTTSKSAYSLFLKGRRAWRAGDEAGALKLVLEAIQADDGYARAQAYVGYFYAYNLFSQTLDLDEEETIERAREHMERSLSLDNTDPFVLQRAAMTFLLIGDPKAALKHAEAAEKVSARDSEILVINGLIQVCCGGDKVAGLAALEQGLALEPRPTPGYICAMVDARHIVRDYQGSLEALRPILDPPHYLQLCEAANLARLGRTEEARDVVRSIPPSFSAERFARSEARSCADPADAEHWLESFRLAGVEV